MPYVGRDGSIYPERPWGLGRILDIFWGFVDLVTAFFMTLIPIQGGDNQGYSSGSSRGPRPPPGNPRRNVRGFSSMSSWQPPPCGASGG